MSARTARLRYYLSDAWEEVRHSPGVNILALTTLSAALFVAGLVLLVLANVEGWIGDRRDAVHVDVYLLEPGDAGERASLERTLAQLPGVREVRLVTREQALERYQASFGELAGVPGELESNPFPASFEVALEPGPGAAERAREVVESASGRAGVDEAVFDQGWLDQLEVWLGLARLGGLALALPIFGALVFVMASVLRLAVYARRDEIEIMLLVGATPAFVRGPFLVAGLCQGLLGAVIAVILTEVGRRLLLAYVDPSSLLAQMVAGRPLPWHFAGLLIGVSLAISLTAAFFAVRRDRDGDALLGA
ncbi:hypothetical protein ABI59_12715 [Acidobacteria bacterium Mor1]|nr:hypothetical protein ABI59_12715 [Acidobacteria bacterium Mor1]